METSIIIAIISFIGTVIMGIFQFRLNKSQANKVDAETINLGIHSSIDINTFYKALIEDIRTERDYYKEENKKLRLENDNLRNKLEICWEKTHE